MAFFRTIYLFVASGVVLPVFFLALWPIVDGNRTLDLALGQFLQNLQLMFWPSSILMLPFESIADAWLPLAISIGLNMVLYSIIGAAFWYGLNRHRWVLFPLGLAVLALW